MTGSSMLQVGAQALRVEREILTQVPDTAPEGAIRPPANLQGTLASGPVPLEVPIHDAGDTGSELLITVNAVPSGTLMPG